jgi:formiminoglutamase
MIWTKTANYLPENYLYYQTGNQIKYVEPKDWEKQTHFAKIAVLNYGQDDFFRAEWYELTANFPLGTVIDLGIIQGGFESLQETILELKKNGIFAIIISPLPLSTFDFIENNSDIALVDSHLQFKNPILKQLLADKKTPKVWLSHQSYYTENDAVGLLEKTTNLLRLGALKTDITELEPILRTTQTLIFNPRAVNAADLPLENQPNPNGLTAAECCKMIRYTAINEHLNQLIISPFEYKKNNEKQAAHLLAQAIWFAIEGFFLRKNDYPLQLTKLQCYSVSVQEWNEPIHFFKSQQSERWWFAVPTLLDEKNPTSCLRACAYKDYQKASEGELTARIWGYFL